MTKKTLLFVAALILMFQCQAQVNVDSLLQIWNDRTKPDTVRLEAMNIVAGSLRGAQPDTAFYFAQLLFDRAGQTNGSKWMTDALNLQGYITYTKGNYTKALEFYNKGLAIATKADYKRGAARVLNNIGLIYMEQGDQAAAIDFFTRSMNIKEQLGDMSGLISGLINIANLYEGIEEFDSALVRYDRALTLSKKFGNRRGILYCLGNMGMVYKTRGNYDKAIILLTEALERADEGDQLGIARANGGLGMVYLEKGEYQKAIEYFNRSLKIGEQLGAIQGMGAIYHNLGVVYRKLGEPQRSISYNETALSIAKEVGHAADMKSAAQELYKTYKALGNPTKALEMHELYIAMRDSIMSEENQRETIRTEFSREAEQRESQIALLNLENEKKQAETLAERNKRMFTLGVSGSLIILLLGGGFFLQRSRKQKHQVEISRAELQKNLVENDFLRSQLDPHFVKNALFNIDGLLGKDRVEDAQRYTDRFHRLMELTLKNARRGLVGLDEELEMMEHYLALEAERLENRLEWTVKVADDVNPEEIELPPMILQPLVENALKHGADMKSGKGQVSLEVSVENNRVLCTVQDNGSGIDLEQMARSTSDGLRITRQRLEMFSKLNLADARLELLNTGSGTWAVVSFQI